MELVVLSDEKGLVGRDLEPVFRAFKTCQQVSGVDARFKKKEPLSGLSKSVLKHRLQALTGRSAADLEEALGFSVRGGRAMGADDARRLAHLLILHANGVDLPGTGEAEEQVRAPSPKKTPKRKRVSEASSSENGMEVDEQPPPAAQASAKKARVGRRSLAAAMEPAAAPSPAAKAATPRGRRSLAPEALRAAQENLACKLTPTPGLRGRRKQEVIKEEEEEDENLGMGNPTPAMVALKKRKSMGAATAATSSFQLRKSVGAATATTTSSQPRKSLGAASTATSSSQLRKKAEPLPPPAQDPGFTGVPLQSDPTARCRAFLVCAQPVMAALEPGMLASAVPDFGGANLTLLHTPSEWQPPEVFSAVQAVRNINREAGLDRFIVLVGVGLVNMHMFREALLKQTSHVQLLTAAVDALNADADDGKLREVTSHFHVAYFFPGCNEEGSALPERMVREGSTTLLRAATVEELENLLVHSFSEDGDWLLDLCCRSRELSLAAMKTGRFAVAVDEDATKLESLRRRAVAIQKQENKRNAKTGAIIKL